MELYYPLVLESLEPDSEHRKVYRVYTKIGDEFHSVARGENDVLLARDFADYLKRESEITYCIEYHLSYKPPFDCEFKNNVALEAHRLPTRFRIDFEITLDKKVKEILAEWDKSKITS